MRINLRSILSIAGAGLLFWSLTAMATCIPSKGVTGAITFPPTTGWGTPTCIGSTGMSCLPAMAGPPVGNLQVFHASDGIYIQVVFNVSEAVNDYDEVDLRFSLNDNTTTSPGANDWGVALYANTGLNPPMWGPVSNPASWTAVPAGDVSVKSTGPQQWTFVFHLPASAPIPYPGAPFSVNPIGFGIQFNDPIANFENLSAQYTQWPTNNVNPLYNDPSQWGSLCFDPTTTYPDISVSDVQNTGPAGPYGLSHSPSGSNSFEVFLGNLGGTVVPNATNVRVNLYLSAFGLGEPWHRLDTFSTLTTDCATNSGWSTYAPVAQSSFCNGTSPQQDISQANLADVNAETATYTINNGISANPDPRLPNIEIDPSPPPYTAVSWTLTSQQDQDFLGPRKHECMWAEAVVPNDPNTSNNHVQRNLNFLPSSCTGCMIREWFSLSWHAFAQYDPNLGKSMYLQVGRQNMDDSFKFELAAANVKPLQNGVYEAALKGLGSFPVEAQITANNPGEMGKILKENLLIPPKAGAEVERGCHNHWWCFLSGIVELFEGRDTEEPVYVKVQANTTLWIANYSLDDNDIQYVNVDGKGPLPPNGPIGLSPGQVKGNRGKLLVPNARVGELVLSFDNFKTGIGIGQGVQVRVPPGANYLALAINDSQEKSEHHKGTGFRVMISEHPPVPAAGKQARTMTPQVDLVKGGGQVEGGHQVKDGRIEASPIVDVLPQVCVNGFSYCRRSAPSLRQRIRGHRSEETHW